MIELVFLKELMLKLHENQKCSIFVTIDTYFSQVFLQERKYDVKEKRMPEYITDDIEISSDSDREDSDKENPDEENFDRENFNEENEVKNVHIKKILYNAKNNC